MYIISSTQLLFDKVPNQKYINILKELCEGYLKLF